MKKINVILLTGNLGTPSKTMVLGEMILNSLSRYSPIISQVISLSDYAHDFGLARNSGEISRRGQEALSAIASTDLLIAVTPVYKGSYTGLFKHLIDFLEPESLLEVPVIIGATGGGEKHALIIEHQLRPLFGFFGAFTVPSGVYASDKDFDGYRLVNRSVLSRVEDAARQGALLACHISSSSNETAAA